MHTITGIFYYYANPGHILTNNYAFTSGSHHIILRIAKNESFSALAFAFGRKNASNQIAMDPDQKNEVKYSDLILYFA